MAKSLRAGRTVRETTETSRTTTAEPPATGDRVSEIAKKFTALEKSYVDIQKACSWLPLIAKEEVWFLPKEHSKFRNPIAWRVLTRIFVDAHMKRVLSAARRYLLLEAQVVASADDRRRLEQLAEDATGFLGQLRSIPRITALLVTAWPILIVVVPLLSPAGSFLRSHVFLSIPLLLSFVYVTLPLRHAFIRTRELFYPGVTVAELAGWRVRGIVKGNRGRQLRTTGPNTYGTEDELFAALKFRKPLEPRLDLFVGVVVAVVTFAILAVFGWRNLHSDDDTLVVLGIFMLLAELDVVAFLFYMVVDTWHRRAR
jgi:hypothetical protein